MFEPTGLYRALCRQVGTVTKENPQHRAVIEAGGGIYVPGMLEHLVLFQSPKTGTTLSLPENRLTSEEVRSRILSSDTSFRK